jgi:hypothetical protein
MVFGACILTTVNWHQKEPYFKKQLGFENVSLRAEVHLKICDQLIEA